MCNYQFRILSVQYQVVKVVRNVPQSKGNGAKSVKRHAIQKHSVVTSWSSSDDTHPTDKKKIPWMKKIPRKSPDGRKIPRKGPKKSRQGPMCKSYKDIAPVIIDSQHPLNLQHKGVR
jgi:hypothetical protein